MSDLLTAIAVCKVTMQAAVAAQAAYNVYCRVSTVWRWLRRPARLVLPYDPSFVLVEHDRTKIERHVLP